MTTETPESPPTKTVELHEIAGPEIITLDVGMLATDRCDRCGAQAYVEVEVWDKEDQKKRDLLFCVHHYREHEDALVLSATRIVDHRPFLALQEEKFKNAVTP